MNDAVKHELPVDTLAETAQRLTRPFYLVDIMFPGNPFYVSSQRSVEYAGQVYVAHGIELNEIEFTSKTTSPSVIRLSNRNFIASSLILNYGIQGVAVVVRKAYLKDDGTFTEPRIFFQGEGDDSTIFPAYADITVTKPDQNKQFAPGIVFSAENGFNHLVQSGTVVTINGEKYQLGNK